MNLFESRSGPIREVALSCLSLGKGPAGLLQPATTRLQKRRTRLVLCLVIRQWKMFQGCQAGIRGICWISAYFCDLPWPRYHWHMQNQFVLQWNSLQQHPAQQEQGLLPAFLAPRPEGLEQNGARASFSHVGQRAQMSIGTTQLQGFGRC